MNMQRVDLLCAAACGGMLIVCGAMIAPALAQDGGGGGGANRQAAIEAARKAPTPKLNGKSDLTGFWGNVQEFGSAEVVTSADGKKVEFQIAPPFSQQRINAQRARAGAPRGGGAAAASGAEPVPPYKTEHLAKVEQLRVTDVDTDPSFICNPHGVPRAGIPQEIFQSKDAVVLLYLTGQRADYRVIPTDGRKHDDTLDPSWYGDSVGHWEGTTLVIDSVNFTDESWLGGGGWFHSDQMKVTERLTREGNTLRWEAVVTDPEVLQRPWIVPPRTVALGKGNAHLTELAPCHERDQAHMVDKYHIVP